MIPLDSLVIYKTKPAIVKEIDKDKYNITLIFGTTAKVRDKDIELLHPGPVNNFDGFEKAEQYLTAKSNKVSEARELLSEESESLSLKDLAGFICGEYTPVSAYAAYLVIQDGLYFSGSITDIKINSAEETEKEKTVRCEKQKESEDRADFLERCRKNQISKEDLKFMQDVEALAYGKTDKSRTLKELKLGETPEDAHDFLLKNGIWSKMINPYPSRFGLSLNSAAIIPDSPPEEEPRRDLCHMEVFAIDSPWTDDPDDAVSIETSGENSILYVHVADPASSIKPDSAAESEARDRGATLYLPEATVRMIAEESLPMFALGLSEKSLALTFAVTINKSGEIINTEIFPSIVKIRRLSFEEADKLLNNNETLRALNELTQRIYKRRCNNGAVDIELPDVHITIKNENVNIQPYNKYLSSLMVRECMIAAGEGAGTWASKKNIAMPYISQEMELPNSILPGYAGSMQLRKSMRPRVISAKPGEHQGMGLDIYVQVTSPLRRYTDLLAHMQIRAVLKGETPLSADEVSARFGYSEAGSVACVQTERASDIHWKMVYLSDKIDSVRNAVVIEKKQNRWLALIPDLALETLVTLDKDIKPNKEIKLVLKSVNIPHGDAIFIQN